MSALAAWFTTSRRQAIYAAVAAIAPVLVWAGRLAPDDVEPILTLTTVALQMLAGVLMLVNLNPRSAGDWFIRSGRATIYALGVAAAPAAVALGWITDEQSGTLLTGLSLGLTALSAVIAVLYATPPVSGPQTPDSGEPADTTPGDVSGGA